MSILESKYKAVQALMRSFVANLSAEDQMMQPCPESSSTKWHPAHTTWFLGPLALQSFVVDYQTFQEKLDRLFNSYYISLGRESADRNRPRHFPDLRLVRSSRSASTLTTRWRDHSRVPQLPSVVSRQAGPQL